MRDQGIDPFNVQNMLDSSSRKIHEKKSHGYGPV